MEKLTDADLYGFIHDTQGNLIIDIHGIKRQVKDILTFCEEFAYMKSSKIYEFNEIGNKKVICKDEIVNFLENNKDFQQYITIGQSVPEDCKLICFTDKHNVIYERYEYKSVKYECYLRVDPSLLEILSYGNNFEYYLDMAKNNGFDGK
jgi:hypothetical protein